MPKRIRLGYLVSEYPAVCHTSLLRELKELRWKDFDISVASINPPEHARSVMTADERAEADATLYVKRASLLGIARAHLSVARRRPLAYLR